MKKIVIILLAFCASYSCFIEAIEQQRLKEFFIDYDSSDEKKAWVWDRLSYAVEKGYPDVAEFFVLYGDPIKDYIEYIVSPFSNDKHIVNNRYVKHTLLTSIRNNYINLSLLMIQHINDMSKAEELKFAATSSNLKPNMIDKKHALQIAIEESLYNHDVIEALLQAKVNVNMSYMYTTYNHPNYPVKYFNPLQSAVALGNLELAQLLLEYNANVDCAYGVAYTPLFTMVESNNIEGVKLLLSYGADPLKVIVTGIITPLELAIQKGHWDIYELLFEVANKQKTTD